MQRKILFGISIILCITGGLFMTQFVRAPPPSTDPGSTTQCTSSGQFFNNITESNTGILTGRCTSPISPSITATLFSNSVILTPWVKFIQNVTNTGSGVTGYCGETENPNNPNWITTYIIGYNFTTNLSGKDAGSIFISFKERVNSTQLWISVFYRSQDISNTLIHGYCNNNDITIYNTSVGALPPAQNNVPPFYTWRETESNKYSFLLLIPVAQFNSNVALNHLPQINATETWTVSTLG